MKQKSPYLSAYLSRNYFCHSIIERVFCFTFVQLLWNVPTKPEKIFKKFKKILHMFKLWIISHFIKKILQFIQNWCLIEMGYHVITQYTNINCNQLADTSVQRITNRLCKNFSYWLAKISLGQKSVSSFQRDILFV